MTREIVQAGYVLVRRVAHRGVGQLVVGGAADDPRGNKGKPGGPGSPHSQPDPVADCDVLGLTGTEDVASLHSLRQQRLT